MDNNPAQAYSSGSLFLLLTVNAFEKCYCCHLAGFLSGRIARADKGSGFLDAPLEPQPLANKLMTFTET